VRRVLIADTFEDLLPRYMNFIKGVVDSEDLPLNVSRETLAQSKVLKVMRKKITKKVLEMLRQLADPKAEEEEKDDKDEADDIEVVTDSANSYDKFWEAYGKSLKLGVIDDKFNKKKLEPLLRYRSTKSKGKLIGFQNYIDNMKENQKHIYYITGESEEAVINSPLLEQLIKKDLEVIYMCDPLDEYVVQSVTEFDGKELMSVNKGQIVLGDEEKKKAHMERLKEDFKPLVDWLQTTYGKKVEGVEISNRLEKSPCVLVTSKYGWSANMERIMKAQTFGDKERSQYLVSRKTMEINPRHPVINELKARVAENAEDPTLKDLAALLYDAALLTSGFSMDDANDFASRIQRVVSVGLNVKADAPLLDEPDYDLDLPPPVVPDIFEAPTAEIHDEL